MAVSTIWSQAALPDTVFDPSVLAVAQVQRWHPAVQAVPGVGGVNTCLATTNVGQNTSTCFVKLRRRFPRPILATRLRDRPAEMGGRVPGGDGAPARDHRQPDQVKNRKDCQPPLPTCVRAPSAGTNPPLLLELFG